MGLCSHKWVPSKFTFRFSTSRDVDEKKRVKELSEGLRVK